MLYQFKSAASGDVIMLESAGRQMLAWMGKSADAQGILLPEDMPAAVRAIEAALAKQDAMEKEAIKPDLDDEPQDAPARSARTGVSWRARAWPLLALIAQSEKAKVPITWGV